MFISGSINLFAVPFGCLVSGPISTFLGRKRTMQISMIPFISAWLILYYSKTSQMLFVALSLTGLTGGLVEAPVLTYVAEVTQPHLRGMLSATSTMAVIIGIFTQFLTGKLLTNWRTICMVNLIYPVICFTTLSLVPESPYWLAGIYKKKYFSVKKNNALIITYQLLYFFFFFFVLEFFSTLTHILSST